MEAGIKSISPGLSIRDMLEIKSDLTLTQLKTILKGHFKEDSSTDLYHRLVNMTQDSRESPQNFLFRAIELQERLLLPSRKVGSDEQYSPELIQKKLLRSVGTGLLSDHIKFQLKPFLDDLAVIDEVLIVKMNEAASVESERQSKQRKNIIKVPKVNELQTDMKNSQCQDVAEARVGVLEQSAEVMKHKSRKAPVFANQRESELYETVKLLREEMAEIRKSLVNPKRPAHQTKTSAKRGCRVCKKQGIGDQCKHCIKCGQSGHFSRGCRGQRLVERSDSMIVTIQTAGQQTPSTSSQPGLDDQVHGLLCDRIRQLEAEFEKSGKARQTASATYASHRSLHRQAKLKALIGKKVHRKLFL